MCGRNEKDKQLELKIDDCTKNADYLIRRYINSVKKKKTSYTRYVYSTYLVSFDNYLKTNNIDIKNVKSMDIDDYINYISFNKSGKENGNQIINARLSAIISFYDFLKENEVVVDNPCSNNKKLKVPEKTTVTYLTPKEVKEIKFVIEKGKGRYKKYINRDIAIIELGCSTGLRVSAIVNIDIEDIDMNNNKITVIEKGNKKRDIFFGNNTKETLQTWIEDRKNIIGNNTGALFISKNKTRMSRNAVSDMLKSATKEAKIDKNITPHKMRSTFGMNFYEQTKDIYLTQNMMGHSNIKNTMIYVKATEEQERKAANVFDSLY